MTSAADNLWTLWMCPLNATRFASDLMETSLAAPRVVATRLPMISDAMFNPLSADHVELRRMVTEKTHAFGSSARALGAVAKTVQQSSQMNARALGNIAGGTWLWPTEWVRLAEANLAAAAALATLPAAALAPLHRGVTANDRRLGRSCRNA